MVRIPIEACNEDGEQVRSYEVDGKEYPDSRPMEIPIGCSKPQSLMEIMKGLVRSEISEAARLAELETFDEASDFGIEDDPIDPLTPWEALFEPLPPQEQAATPPAEAGSSPAPAASQPAPSSPQPLPDKTDTGSPQKPGGAPQP